MKAFIDLGTNTFHCKIVQFSSKADYNIQFYQKIFVKIGEDGIENGFISKTAIKRAENALEIFQKSILERNVTDVLAIGTSAMRNATNSNILVQKMNNWNWQVQIIDGKREAELIYKGVISDPKTSKGVTSLIMDIGGGSVEFIIGLNEKILWSQSFEIGAQRLKDLFHKNEIISNIETQNLNTFLSKNLEELYSAVKKYEPECFIGSSGTFDTILEIANLNREISNSVNLKEFEHIFETLLHSTILERENMAGMQKERAEMIVVASTILNHVLVQTEFKSFFVSSYALKEGLIYEELQKIS